MHNSLLNVYSGLRLDCVIPTKFTVMSCPKVYLTQHISPSLIDPYAIRILISIFNYEPCPLTDLKLMHTVCPNLNAYQMIRGSPVCRRNQNTVFLDIPYLPPLSAESMEIEVSVKGPGEYTSQARLIKDLPEKRNHVIQIRTDSWIIG
jgi:hypothetical protein